jgi:hypothetical protein
MTLFAITSRLKVLLTRCHQSHTKGEPRKYNRKFTNKFRYILEKAYDYLERVVWMSMKCDLA